MSSKYIPMSSKYIAILFVCFFLSACDLSGPQDAIDDFQLLIGLEPINTVVSGQIMDAATGELVDREVTLQFAGQNSDAIIDVYSDPLTEQSVSGGLISFGIDNSVVPSESNPVRFTVVAEASNYLEASQTVVLRSNEDEQFTLYLVSENNPPEGSSSTQQSAGETANDGAVTSSFEVETPEEEQSQGSASVSVEGGTVASDASGSPLTGQLTTKLTYFNNKSEQALRSFPGGAGSGPDGSTLVTAGFASINIEDQSGRKARTFNKPIGVGLSVPSDMKNPSTGESLQPGETLGVYSYEPSDGEWVSEGEVTVEQPQPDGKYHLKFAANHLSYYSLGFQGVSSCDMGAAINVNRNGNKGPLKVLVHADGVSHRYTIPKGQSSLTLRNVPAVEAEVSVTVPGGTASVTIEDVCSGSYTLNLPEPPGNLLDVTFNFVPVCSNTDEGVRVESIPSFVVYYRKSNVNGGTWDRGGTVQWSFNDATKRLEKGSLQIEGLEEGETYTLKTTYEGETETREETITGSAVRIEENADHYCQ